MINSHYTIRSHGGEIVIGFLVINLNLEGNKIKMQNYKSERKGETSIFNLTSRRDCDGNVIISIHKCDSREFLKLRLLFHLRSKYLFLIVISNF